MGMDFWGQVWKQVWEMAFFGLKLGLDLEMRAAHPHQKFQGVPPSAYIQLWWDTTKLENFWATVAREQIKLEYINKSG